MYQMILMIVAILSLIAVVVGFVLSIVWAVYEDIIFAKEFLPGSAGLKALFLEEKKLGDRMCIAVNLLFFGAMIFAACILLMPLV